MGKAFFTTDKTNQPTMAYGWTDNSTAMALFSTNTRNNYPNPSITKISIKFNSSG